MTKELTKPRQGAPQELELSDPLLEEKDPRVRRERSVERLQLLWTERKFLARAAGLGLVAATAMAFLLPKRFVSSARLMPPDQASVAGTAMMAALAGRAGGSLGSLGGELLGLKTTGDLFIGILQSRTVEDDLIAKFNLRKTYGVRLWEDARKRLAAATNVSQERKSGILTISVTDRSAARAQQMGQEYVQELNQVVISLNTSAAHRERVFLADRLREVRQDLEAAEKDFSQFASKNTAIDIQVQGKAMIEAGATLQGELIAAQTQLEGLRQIFTDNNVRVRATRARVDELKRQLHRLSGNSADAADGPQDQAPVYPTIRQLPVLGVPYADLYRRMKVQEAVFETLTQQYEVAKVEEAKETPSVKVLDPPDLPEKKSFPPRLLIMFLGTFLSFLSAMAWLLAQAAWQATDSTDARKVFAGRVWTDLRATVLWFPGSWVNGSRQSSSFSEVRAEGPPNERASAVEPDRARE